MISSAAYRLRAMPTPFAPARILAPGSGPVLGRQVTIVYGTSANSVKWSIALVPRTPRLGAMPRRKADRLLDSEKTILAALAESPRHGWALAEALGQPRRTIFGALQRLDSKGLLSGRWDTTTAPPRRVYKLTSAGRRALPPADPPDAP